MNNKVFKIKSSVDLFLIDNKILTAYFINTRKRQSFKINDKVIKLLENLDGVKTVKELKENIKLFYDVNENDIESVLLDLKKNKIIYEEKEIEFLDKKEKERYSRQINFFGDFFERYEDAFIAQKKMKEVKVLIFGVGSVGSIIAQQLVMAGVINITLFDYDKVEESDVARHMFFDESRIGYNKVDVLKDELLSINSNLNIKIINKILNYNTEIDNIIKKYDFIVNTLDEPYIGYTSAKISRSCIKNNIPHYIAGGFDAHLASTGELIIPFKTACVECYATHFKESLKNWKPSKHPIKHRREKIGGIVPMSLFSASFASLEIIKYLTGIILNMEYKSRGEFLFEKMDLEYLKIKKDSNCRICSGKEMYDTV